eukprot:Gb_05463 [translate_table: standard]
MVLESTFSSVWTVETWPPVLIRLLVTFFRLLVALSYSSVTLGGLAMTLHVSSALASCVVNHYDRLPLIGGIMGMVYGGLRMSENAGDLHTSVLRDTRGDTWISWAKSGGVMRPTSRFFRRIPASNSCEGLGRGGRVGEVMEGVSLVGDVIGLISKLAAVAAGNPDRPIDGVNTIGMFLTSPKANTAAGDPGVLEEGDPGVLEEDEGRDPDYISLACLRTRQRPIDGVNTIGMFLTSPKANTAAGDPGVLEEDEGRDPDYISLACLRTRQRRWVVGSFNDPRHLYKPMYVSISRHGRSEGQRICV